MTLIVYRDGIMAADRQGYSGDTRSNHATKIARRESDGALIGMCGAASICASFVRWFLAGEQGEPPALRADANNSSGGFVVRPDGSVEQHDEFGWHLVEGMYFATGCGLEAALAAMDMGASAKRAVEIAAARNAFVGGGIDVLYLDASRVVSLRE